MFLRVFRKIIVDEKLARQFFWLSWFLKTYIRYLRRRCMIVTFFIHIKLSNLMCVWCIKRLTTDFRHICVTRFNRKKCRYCAHRRHKCVFVNVRLRVICKLLFIFVNVSLFLKYDVDVKKWRRSFHDERFHQSSNRLCFLISCVFIYNAH